MKNFSRAFDYILSRIIIFALAFIWCRFYIDALWLSVAAAFGITFVLSFFLYIITRGGKKKKAVSKSEKQHMEQVITQFMYSTNQQNIEYFYNLIKDEYPATKLPECVLSENNKVKTLIFARFAYAALSPDSVRETYIECRRYNAQRAIIFTNSLTDKAKDAASRIEGAEIILMDAENTYRFLKEFNMYPAITVNVAPKRRKPLKVFLKFAFSRTKVKAYLWGAAVMLLCSFAVRYNLYYLISATVFLVFALISFINFKFKREPEKSLL